MTYQYFKNAGLCQSLWHFVDIIYLCRGTINQSILDWVIKVT